jgi:hypothetical protein
VICLEEKVFMCHICIIYVHNILLHILTLNKLCIWFIAWRQGDTTFHMFVLKMYVQIMSLSALLCNVCVFYVYILKMSKKIKVKK